MAVLLMLLSPVAVLADEVPFWQQCASFLSNPLDPLNRPLITKMQNHELRLTFDRIPAIIRQSTFFNRWDKAKKFIPAKHQILVTPGFFGRTPSAEQRKIYQKEYERLLTFITWIKRYQVEVTGQVYRYLSYLAVIAAALNLTDQGVVFVLYVDPHLQRESYLMIATEQENAQKHFINQLATKLLTKRQSLRLVYSPERNFLEDAVASYQAPSAPGEEHYLNLDNWAPFKRLQVSPVLWHEFIHASTGTVFNQQRPFPFFGVLIFSPHSRHRWPWENEPIDVLFFDESTAYFRGVRYELRQLRRFVREALRWPSPKEAVNEFNIRLGQVISSLEYCWEFNLLQAQIMRQVYKAIQKGDAQLVVFPFRSYDQVYHLLNRKVSFHRPNNPKFAPGDLLDGQFNYLQSDDDYDYFLRDGNIFPQDGNLRPYLYAKIITKSPAGTLYLAFPRIFPKAFKNNLTPRQELNLAKKEVSTYLTWAAQVAMHQKRETLYVMQSLQEMENNRSARKRLNPQMVDYLGGLNSIMSGLHSLLSPEKKIHQPTTAELEERSKRHYHQARLDRKK